MQTIIVKPGECAITQTPKFYSIDGFEGQLNFLPD